MADEKWPTHELERRCTMVDDERWRTRNDDTRKMADERWRTKGDTLERVKHTTETTWEILRASPHSCDQCLAEWGWLMQASYPYLGCTANSAWGQTTNDSV